jgi:serine protease Do
MKDSWKNLLTRWPSLAACSAVLVAVATIAATSKEEGKQPSKAASPPAVAGERSAPRETVGRYSFAPVVKKVSPSVVKVNTTVRTKQTSLQGIPDLDNPLLRRFFGDQFGRPGRQPRLEMPPQHGVGSGVIVTKDGYILTNNHVVDGADEVKVALLDGREFTAKVVGRDPQTDLAVVKVEGSDLPAVEMADSDKIEVGDVVLAIGNPFGIGQTVTTGIISATGRATLGLDYEDFIQTDAAINPGNSGGALVDVDGRLIGINTAILSRSGGNQGIGFAIPTNLARDVKDQLVKNGSVTRGYLGVMIQDVTPALAKEFKLKQQKGALVGDVVPKGPADKAGLKSGDVVMEFNGRPVRDSRYLKLEVARVKPGSSVQVKVLRDGATKALEVKAAELPGSEKLAKSDSQSSDTEALQGVAVTDLDPQARRQFNVPETVKGALVADVEGNSAAREAGLKPGDVILEINRQPVKTAEDAVKLTENPKDKTTLLRVWSNGGTRYVVVDETKAG